MRRLFLVFKVPSPIMIASNMGLGIYLHVVSRGVLHDVAEVIAREDMPC